MLNDLVKVVLLTIFIVCVIAFGPILVIWALNTLFPVLAIPYNIWTWLSIAILGGFVRGRVQVKK